jgi:FMN reductase
MRDRRSEKFKKRLQMKSKRIVALSGSTRRPSKTRAVVEAVAARYADKTQRQVKVYDLLDVGLDFAMATSRDQLSEIATHVFSAVESADGLIIGSPVYKGAYAGHFKHFFDLCDPRSLSQKPICLIATGGGHRHTLVGEQFLRPLFGFFEALTLPTIVYAGETDFRDGHVSDASVAIRINQAATELAQQTA